MRLESTKICHVLQRTTRFTTQPTSSWDSSRPPPRIAASELLTFTQRRFTSHGTSKERVIIARRVIGQERSSLPAYRDLGVLATLATKIASNSCQLEQHDVRLRPDAAAPPILLISSHFTCPGPLSPLFALSWERESVASATIRVADVGVNVSLLHADRSTRYVEQFDHSIRYVSNFPLLRAFASMRPSVRWRWMFDPTPAAPPPFIVDLGAV